MEDAGSLAQLAGLVPAADEEVGGWVEDAFDEADEEADGNHVVAGSGGCEGEREHCPYELAAGDPDRGADFGEDELRGELADDLWGDFV